MAGQSREFVQKQSSTHSSVLEEAASALSKTAARTVILTLLLVGLSWWSWSAVDASLRRHVRSQLETHLDSTRAAVDLWTEGVLSQLVDASRDAAVVEAVANAAEAPQLDQLVARTLALGYVFTDRSGAIVRSSGAGRTADQLPMPVRDLEAWLASPRPRMWSPAYYGTESGEAKPLLTFSSPVSRGGRVIGALHLLVDPAGRFSEIMMIARPGASGETYAFDSEGRMISQSRFPEQLAAAGLLPDAATTTILQVDVRDPGVSLPDGGQAAFPRRQQPLTRMVQAALASGRGSDVDGYNDYRGVPVVGAWHYSDRHGIGIASEVDVAEAFEVRVGLTRVLGLLFALLAAALLLTVWSGHRNLQLEARSLRAESKAARLGQYTLGRKLGEGGMGTVYMARHALLRRATAVKLIKAPDDGKVSPERFARFEREVQLTAELTHPNTIAIFDYGKTPAGIFYYAMEYLVGVDLDKLVAHAGPLPAGRVAYLILQACGSLAEAHERGLIHRDIKPGNIMVCERGGEYDRVKVLDFGLVKSMEKTPSDPTVTSDAGIAGTPLYMAPEVLSKAGAASVQSDIYALGAVMYFLLAGRDLFPDRDTVAVIVAQMTLAPDPLAELAPSVPPALAELVHRCLAKDPAERPGSARELAALVRAVSPTDWDAETARTWWQEHRAMLAAVPAHD
jgi:hypothetical protein